MSKGKGGNADKKEEKLEEKQEAKRGKKDDQTSVPSSATTAASVPAASPAKNVQPGKEGNEGLASDGEEDMHEGEAVEEGQEKKKKKESGSSSPSHPSVPSSVPTTTTASVSAASSTQKTKPGQENHEGHASGGEEDVHEREEVREPRREASFSDSDEEAPEIVEKPDGTEDMGYSFTAARTPANIRQELQEKLTQEWTFLGMKQSKEHGYYVNKEGTIKITTPATDAKSGEALALGGKLSLELLLLALKKEYKDSKKPCKVYIPLAAYDTSSPLPWVESAMQGKRNHWMGIEIIFEEGGPRITLVDPLQENDLRCYIFNNKGIFEILDKLGKKAEIKTRYLGKQGMMDTTSCGRFMMEWLDSNAIGPGCVPTFTKRDKPVEIVAERE